MSTNNNRLGKEIQPQWLASSDSSAAPTAFTKISGSKLQRMVSNSIEEITALSLKGKEISKVEDFRGFNKLQRLDLSENKLKRLSGLSDLKSLGMLNVSNNQLDGSASCEELRYLTELRTLNIGYNGKIRHIESHVIKPLIKLQALIANDCGLSKVSFLKHCQLLNTLVLSHNNLTRFPTSFSSEFNFIHLTKLSLGYNELTTLPDLSVCPNISELRLNNNKLTSLTNAILVPSKLKILDISNNLLTSWTEVEILVRLNNLTNLTLRGNLLPPPPNTFDNSSLREDVYTATHDDQLSREEKRYRHHVLSLFQILVGVEQKPKVRLIVLDTKRVKMKWSHREEGAGNVQQTETDERHPSVPSEEKKTKQKTPKVKQSKRPDVSRDEPSTPSVSSRAAEALESHSIASQSPRSALGAHGSAGARIDHGQGYGPDLSGVVSVKILKKTKKRERSDEECRQGPGQGRGEGKGEKQKHKKSKKEEAAAGVGDFSSSDPLLILSKASSSVEAIGTGGSSQWD
jgi:hypothetical protein